MNGWAIKIGGSLYDSHYLVEWLNSINDYSKQNIIVIPGGGPFADQVRRADEKYHLNQTYSHNMAVMAMQQYGILLASLCPTMILADTIVKIHNAWGNSRVAIWEPYKMVHEEYELEKSWDVTSDSLAAWLANKLGLRNLLLVKSSDDVLKEKNVEVLSNHNCIDPSFEGFINKTEVSPHVLHKSELEEFKTLLKCF